MDALFLVNAKNHEVGQWVLPPDPRPRKIYCLLDGGKMNLQQKHLSRLADRMPLRSRSRLSISKDGPSPILAARPGHPALLNKFDRELDLDAQQRESVGKIVDKHHQAMMSLQKEVAAKFADLRMSMRSEIQEILNPEQLKKFQAVTARWDAGQAARYYRRMPLH